MPVTASDPVTDLQPASTPQYIGLVRWFAVRLCVSVTLGVAFLTAVELFSYWRSLHAVKEALEPAVRLDLAQGASAKERAYWQEFEQANKVDYHPYVLWRRAPYQGDLIAIDTDGVRRTLHTHCDRTTFTIWMFGDSVMWGAGAPDDATIPSFVAADYETSGREVCIVNYAEKGWSSTQEVIGLIEELKHTTRKPDVVLFYDGGSEAFTALQGGQADVHSNYNSFKTFLEHWSEGQKAGFSYLQQTNTYRFLETLGAKQPFHRKEAATSASLDAEGLSAAVVDNYAQNMSLVNVLAKHYGFRAIFAWYPNMAVGHKELTSYEQQVLRMEYKHFPGLDVMYQTAYRKARALQYPDFHYLGDLLDDEKGSLYVGISHLKPEGNRIVADRLYDILEHSPGPTPGKGQALSSPHGS